MSAILTCSGMSSARNATNARASSGFVQNACDPSPAPIHHQLRADRPRTPPPCVSNKSHTPYRHHGYHSGRARGPALCVLTEVVRAHHQLRADRAQTPPQYISGKSRARVIALHSHRSPPRAPRPHVSHRFRPSTTAAGLTPIEPISPHGYYANLACISVPCVHTNQAHASHRRAFHSDRACSSACPEQSRNDVELTLAHHRLRIVLTTALPPFTCAP
jgi:hypothetical protein